MRKIIFFWVALVIAVQPMQAVLKERDLARTLGVLRAELSADYEQQQAFMARYEQQGAAQHQQLVWYMNQCEQIGLMLYSQSMDNTFDMAYACQQAVNLYRQLGNRSGLPYEKMIERMKHEIDRYDALIASLKSMPPIDQGDEDVLTESDSILLNAIDSLESHIATTTPVQTEDALPPRPLEESIDEEEHHEPLYLSGEQLRDRRVCLEYAQTLRDNMQTFLEALEAESSYYESVCEKVAQLNSFAQSRYKILQDNIFTNGGSNYFSILADFPRYAQLAALSVSRKYAPFRGQGHNSYSEWRGMPVLAICFVAIFYFVLLLVLTYVVLRWLLPRRWRGENFRMKRQMLTGVIGVAIFAVTVMVVRSLVDRNFIQMSTGLMITIAWLLEVISLSLYIRLKGEQIHHAAKIYMPLMLLSSLVILFHIILIPNSILNLILPPLLLVFTLWQLLTVRRHKAGLPLLDVAYSNITTVVLLISCVATWVGYTLLAVQVLVWWIFQLAAIMSITCFYDLMEMYENRYLLSRLMPELKERILNDEDVSEEAAPILRRMRRGHFITTTWLYDFINLTLVPILAVGSILVSIYWAAEIFEMTSICQKAFYKNFVDESDLIQISLFKLCIVAALWFVFRYLNYAIRGFYVYFRRKVNTEKSPNQMLAKNVIAILTWGIYFIIAMVILNVPKSGISIVTAGLATGLGFAMQDLIENFFYGLSLMTGRLRVGDYIECDGIRGKVENITYQSTQIVTGDGYVIAFLNKALFSKNFKNMTRNHSYELAKIPVGVAYGTDVNEVRHLLIEDITPVCEGTTAAGQPITEPGKPITVIFSDFGESSIDLFVCIWVSVEEKYALSARVKETIYETLNKHHIEIPFPQRDVHIVNK